jgi:predicted RNase H-like HicB family nuclease
MGRPRRPSGGRCARSRTRRAASVGSEKEAQHEGYSAYSPSLPGCFSNGRTIEEAKRNMREAVQQHVAALLAHGESVPQNERLVHVEELSIGLP